MIAINTNGSFRIDFFARTLASITPDAQFQLTNVRVNKLYDKEKGSYTDTVENITYNVFVQELMAQIPVKVDSANPVITPEQLDAAMAAGSDVYIELPTKDTVIKPYKIERGQVYASISAPFVQLVKD